MRWVPSLAGLCAVAVVSVILVGRGPAQVAGQEAPANYSAPLSAPQSPRIPEKSVVKVYSVPDLVAPLQAPQHPAGAFAGSPEMAGAMQQIVMQVQAQAMVNSLTTSADPNAEVTKKLEQLKQALRIAAPRADWQDEGGPGEIEVHADTFSLIIRQTAANHDSIADLLTQLRATQDLEIELAVRLIALKSVKDADTAKVMQLMNRDLTPEEVRQLLTGQEEIVNCGLIRMANGRSAAPGGLFSQMRMELSAIPKCNGSVVNFRLDSPVADDSEATGRMHSEFHSVEVGQTIALLVPAIEGIMLITPKIIDRTRKKAVETRDGGLATRTRSTDGQLLPSAYFLSDDVQYFSAAPELNLRKSVDAIKE